MKKLFLILIALFTVTTGFAQEAVEAVEGLDPSFNAIKSLLLPSVITGALVLLADAKKYMFTPEWDTMKFLKTKALPFGATTVGAIVVYLIIAYVPFLKPFLEVLTETDLGVVTAASLFGAAQAIVNGVLKPTKEVEPESEGNAYVGQ